MASGKLNDADEVRQAGGLLPQRSRIAVYSCYFGSYEPYHAGALGPDGEWDHILFTDRTGLPQDGRRFVVMPPGFDGLTARQLSRLPKLCPEVFLSRYDWVIYVDNRARLRLAPDVLIDRIERQMGGADRTPAGRYLARHSQRNCAWRESRICLRKGFFTQAEFDAIRNRFESAGFPRDAGLFVNTGLIQKMGSETTARLNRAWMEAFCRIAGRDQPLLPFVLWQSGQTQHELGFPLTDIIDWPMFGRKGRIRFQESGIVPEGWDAPSRRMQPGDGAD
jgi:hypothetical protein